MRITDLLDKRSIYLGAKVSSKEETCLLYTSPSPRD